MNLAGSMYHWIKEFAQYNLHLNNAELEYEGPSRIVWPLTAIISDNVVMMKKIESESGRYGTIIDTNATYDLEKDHLPKKYGIHFLVLLAV